MFIHSLSIRLASLCLLSIHFSSCPPQLFRIGNTLALVLQSCSGHGDSLVDVDVEVCLIDDLFPDQFLDHVLQSDNALEYRLCECVCVCVCVCGVMEDLDTKLVYESRYSYYSMELCKTIVTQFKYTLTVYASL